MLSSAQRERLLRAIHPKRVSKDGKGFSYVEAFEITAHLNRIFGFEGWSKEITDLTLIFEDETTMKSGKPGYNVLYRCSLRLTIHDGGIGFAKEDAATGEATQPSKGDAHDLAMKSAVSGALKRCAKDLGDQFGLSLYDHGSMNALVQSVIPYSETP